MTNHHILVAEDEVEIADLVRLHLVDLGYTVSVEHSGPRALERAEGEPVDLVILDIGLPGLDGLEICRRLRSRDRYVPILMLTARSSEVDRVVGLEMGADDYLTKPFSVRELMARVKALLRRVEGIGRDDRLEGAIRAGGLTVDPVRREAKLDDQTVDLTAKEFDLLYHFASNPERVFTRSQLLDSVWGYAHGGYEHTVNTHINRLRSKIEPDPSDPRFILTVWGVGYRFPSISELES
jgi:DNA-binding response OmpR family regulator